MYLNGTKKLTTGTALVFDGSNLGINVTPSGWTTYKALQIGPFAAFADSNTGNIDLSANRYNASGDKYINSGYASMLRQVDGAFKFFTAASGTAGNAITFTQAMTLTAAGSLGLGTTSPSFDDGTGMQISRTGVATYRATNTTGNISLEMKATGSLVSIASRGSYPLIFEINGAEVSRFDSSGNFLVAKTSSGTSVVGFEARASGVLSNTVSGATGVFINRLSNDGSLIDFQQDNSAEGSISVSGTTVSYNGGHLSRWAQTTAPKDDTLVKGTVLSNLDAMNVYTDADGNPVDNEQLNKVKVSDVEGDANVAGVFVNWTHDDQHDVDEINMAMTGDMIIRIAQGTTVQRGDLLMSAGNGTAMPQADDIVRSKTVAKVTSTHVTCTYADGSYCVPCVLMAC
jgi:hypothetical protein